MKITYFILKSISSLFGLALIIFAFLCIFYDKNEPKCGCEYDAGTVILNILPIVLLGLLCLIPCKMISKNNVITNIYIIVTTLFCVALLISIFKSASRGYTREAVFDIPIFLLSTTAPLAFIVYLRNLKRNKGT